MRHRERMLISRREFIAMLGSAAAIAALPTFRKGATDERGMLMRDWSGGTVHFEMRRFGHDSVYLMTQSVQFSSMKEMAESASTILRFGYQLVSVIDEGYEDRESSVLSMACDSGGKIDVDFTKTMNIIEVESFLGLCSFDQKAPLLNPGRGQDGV